MKIFTLSLLLALTNSLLAQTPATGWLTTLPPEAPLTAPALLPTPDGGHLVAGLLTTADGTDLFAAKLDANGETVWLTQVEKPGEQRLLGLFPANGGYRIAGKETGPLFFQNLTEEGQFGNLETTSFSISPDQSLALAQNGDLLAGGWTSSFSFAERRTSIGFPVWWKLIDQGVCGAGCNHNDQCRFLTERPGGNLLTGGHKLFGDVLPNGQVQNLQTKSHLTSLSSSGDVLWRRYFANSEQIKTIAEMPNGELVATANAINIWQNTGFRLHFLTASGVEIWSQFFTGTQVPTKILPHADGTFTLTGTETADVGFGSQTFIFLQKMDTLGNEIWHRRVPVPVRAFATGATADSTGYTLAAVTGEAVPRVSIFRLDGEGNLFPNLASGKLLHDFNGNCTSDASDGNLPGWELHFFKNNALDTFRLRTDGLGNFALQLDTGTFELRVETPDEFWTACQNSLTISNLGDSLHLDLLVLDTCPDLQFSPKIYTACGEGAAEIDLQVSGGFGPSYQFQWSNGGADSLLTGLTSGLYHVTVTDGNCFHADSVVVAVQQSMAVQWQRTWGGSNDDRPTHLAPTLDGGWLVSGKSESSDGGPGSNFGFDDAWLLRLDSTGHLQWQKKIGSSGWDDSGACGMDGAGNIWLTGKPWADDHDFEGFNLQGGDVFLARMDGDGNVENLEILQGQGFDGHGPMAMLNDGMVLCINSNSGDGDFIPNTGGYDAWAFRYGSDGNLLWKKNLSETGLSNPESDEEITALATLPDGGLLFAGKLDDVGPSQVDFWLQRTDAAGNLLWVKKYGGSKNEGPLTVMPLADGNFLWAGSTLSNDGDVPPHSGSLVTWLLKTDPDGEIIWSKVLPVHTQFLKLLPAPDDSFWLTASYSTVPVTHVQFRLDFEGNVLEQFPLDPLNYLRGLELLPNGEGFVFLAIGNESYHANLIDSHGREDFWLGKLGNPLPLLDALGADTIACPGTEVMLVAEVPGCGACSYLWDDGSTGQERTFTVNETLLASVVVTTPDGCQGIDRQLVTKNRLDAKLTIGDANCGVANGHVFAQGQNSPVTPGPNYFFNWDNGETSSNLVNLPAGEYHLTISDGVCEAEKTATVELTEAFKGLVWQWGESGSRFFKNISELPDSSIVGLFRVENENSPLEVGNYLQKFSATGELLWQKTLGYHVGNFAPTPDGGFAIADNASGQLGFLDYRLKKLDAAGELEWEMTYPAPGHQEAHGLCLTPDGGYLLAGWSDSGGGSVPGMYGSTNDNDAWVMKVNEIGEVVWSKIYGGTGTDEVNAIVLLPEGGYVVAGRSFSQNGTQMPGMPYGIWLFKINEAGEMLWNHTVTPDQNLNQLPTSIHLLQDGGFGYGRHRFDANGHPVWEKNLGTDYVELPNGEFIGVETTSAGGGGGGGGRAWLTGSTYGFDNQGNTLWTNSISGTTPPYLGYLVRQLSDGNFLVAGQHAIVQWGGQFPPPPYYAHFLKKWKAPTQLAEHHPPDTLLACLESPFAIGTGNAGLPHLWDDGSTAETRWVTEPGSYSAEVGGECSEVFHFEVLDAGAGCLENISQSVALCHGEAWQGQIFTSDTLLVDTIFGSGSTQVVATSLEILPAANTHLSETICLGDSLTIGQLPPTMPGEYTFIFQNQNGCDSFVFVSLSTFPVPTASAETTLSCPPQFTDGSIDLTVDSGDGPFTYLWSNGGATTEDVSGLDHGTFSVSVTDVYECTHVFQFEVLPAPGIVQSFDFEQPCPGEATGTLLATPSGEGDLSLNWSTGDTTASLANLPSGIYFLTVTDGNGCTSQAAFPLLALPAITVEFALTPPGLGQSDGQIEVTELMGEPPLTLTWSTGETGGPGSVLDSLPAGIYLAYLSDGNGCTDTVEVLLETASATGELANVLDFWLSPNPASDVVQLNFLLGKADIVAIEISGTQGQILTQLTDGQTFAAGEQQLKLEIGNWPPGVYFVTLRTAEGVAVRRLVRSKT